MQFFKKIAFKIVTKYAVSNNQMLIVEHYEYNFITLLKDIKEVIIK